MLALNFYIGPDRHAVDCLHIARVAPRVKVTSIAGAPEWITGEAMLLGLRTPIVDVRALLLGDATPNLLSSRLLLLNQCEEMPSPLGLLVERMTEVTTLKTPKTDALNAERPWLCAEVFDSRGPIRLIDPRKLVPRDTLAALASVLESF